MADGSLEPRRTGGMPAAQSHSYSALAVHFCGCAPVDFVGADDAVSAAGQFVADSAVLIGVIADRQNHARLQNEYRNSRSGCAASADCIFGDIAGVGDLRSVDHRLFARLFARRNAHSSDRQLRNRVVSNSSAGALIGTLFVRPLIIGVILHLWTSEEMPIGAIGGRDLRDE